MWAIATRVGIDVFQTKIDGRHQVVFGLVVVGEGELQCNRIIPRAKISSLFSSHAPAASR